MVGVLTNGNWQMLQIKQTEIQRDNERGKEGWMDEEKVGWEGEREK